MPLIVEIEILLDVVNIRFLYLIRGREIMQDMAVWE